MTFNDEVGNIIILSDSRYKRKRLMKTQTQQPPSARTVEIKSYSILQWILIVLRLVLMAIVMCCVNIFHEWIRPRIMIPYIRRYLACIVNLLYIRLVLLILGFFKFQCENYRYFDKSSRTMTFKSGWVGVASQKSIVQFLYYSYLFNPTYARIIEYHQESKIKEEESQVKLFYTPLSFRQAFRAALEKGGFDPIVIKGEAQLKRFKRRKMQMPTLISECFQQLNGPVMIFLPTKGYKQQLKTHKCLGQDIYDNQKRFLRSGVVFVSEIEQSESLRSTQNRSRASFSTQTSLRPIEYLIQICSQIKLNVLTITTTETIKHKYEYDRDSYCEFIDEIFMKDGYKMEKIEYKDYLSRQGSCEEQIRAKQEQQGMQISRQAKEQDMKGHLMELDESQEDIKSSMIVEHSQSEQEQISLDSDTIKVD